MKASNFSLYIVSSFEFNAAVLISLALSDALRSCLPLVRIYQVALGTRATLRFFTAGDAIYYSLSCLVSYLDSCFDTGFAADDDSFDFAGGAGLDTTGAGESSSQNLDCTGGASSPTKFLALDLDAEVATGSETSCLDVLQINEDVLLRSGLIGSASGGGLIEAKNFVNHIQLINKITSIPI